MFRQLLISSAVCIILFSAWSMFVRPVYETVVAADSYPGTLMSKVIAKQPLFGQKDSISGTVLVMTVGEDTYVRIEDFKQKKEIPACLNIRAYLTVDLDPKNKLDLGSLKATQGSINYLLPKGTDYKEYTHFMLWCTTFRSDYAHADIIERESKGLFIK